ncbi:MAG TPA: NmrA family NAD(P)-binding protein [Burkholderiales bacterium]|nr:NmrA family NAD(P)-binding protein [Burkholderiales bacterium]
MNHSSNSSAIDSRPTLILGGTGKTGRRIAQILTDRGIPTRVASRSATPSFDWNDPASWDAALEGVRAAYISYAPDLAIPGAANAIRSFSEQAVARGVERLVLLSGRGEEEAQLCEQIVQNAGAEWTIVRASWFNQNFSEGEFLGMVLNGAITLPAGDTPEPFVDADDIAEVAVAALTEDGHAGQVYEVTGPRLLTFAEVAKEISRASGRDVEYIQIPDEAFASAVADSGAPDDIAWLLNYLFSTVLDGRNAYPCDGVQRALGREPTDFADYARRIADSGVWAVPASSQREAA